MILNCVLTRPDKTKITEARKRAEKENRKAFQTWKALEKSKPREQRYRQLTNLSIVHYLQFLISNKRYSELDESLKELRLVYDESILEISPY